MTFCLNLASHCGYIYIGPINKIQVSGEKGELSIYPGHLQLLSFLQSGIINFFDKNNKKHFIYISGGIIEVQPKIVNIITDIAVKISKFDKTSIVIIENSIRHVINNSLIVNKKKLLEKLSNIFKIYIKV
ncbi:MAG: ATP synthase F1 subunit epsilon [Buchnera aphidicola (Schlechtendalia peitan)]